MKRFLVCFACAFWSGVPCFAQLDEVLAQIKEEDVHALLRQTAVKVEEKFKGTHAEADGLAQLVEEILSSPKPPEPAGGDRNQQRAAEMHLMSVTTNAGATLAGVRGFVFDNNAPGHRQRYEELEGQTRTDGEEVLRLLEMRQMAERLEWKDKERLCEERALGAARALVAREPKNAAAHALLAEALRWEDAAETSSALQTALELDPKQPRALELMLDRRMLKVVESAALRRESGLGENVPMTVDRMLYDQPLSEEEMLAFGKRQDELRRDAELLLKLAQERGDLAIYLATVEDLTKLRRHAQVAALASKKAPETSYEEFRQQSLQAALQLIATLFSEDSHLRTALKLAADDPEALGAIMMISLTGDAMRSVSTRQPLPPARLALAEEITLRLVEMARAGSSHKAARASESACIIQWFALIMGQRPPHVEMILHTIRLDPFRHRTQDMLLTLCMQKEDPRGARAVTQIQLALVPDHSMRRMAAAATAKTQDWPAAHRLLDVCLKDKPEDIPLLNQRAATLLKENQSKATQRKAAAIYDKIEKLLEADKAAQPGKDDLEMLVQNGVLFLAICGKNDEAQSRLTAALKEGMISEKAAKELEPWLR